MGTASNIVLNASLSNALDFGTDPFVLTFQASDFSSNSAFVALVNGSAFLKGVGAYDLALSLRFVPDPFPPVEPYFSAAYVLGDAEPVVMEAGSVSLTTFPTVVSARIPVAAPDGGLLRIQIATQFAGSLSSGSGLTLVF